jgi:diaminopimelate decarboxylase
MCHVGSQGVPFDLAIAGIRAIVDFALHINQHLNRKQVQSIDIGGGMSVNFSSESVLPTFGEYAAALQATVPELFDEEVFPNVVTEFGRALVAKTGFFASRVEYVKETGGRRIAIQYAGVDVCARTVYQPTQWPLRVTVLDGDFVERGAENLGETDIAGPCCIQADIIAHKRMLPPMLPGDTVLLHDVGGYYHSAHNTYNLRQSPAVWAFEDAADRPLKWLLVQEAEPIDRMLDAFCEPGWEHNIELGKKI